MRAVGIRELKERLSEYVRAVRAGEEILVTDRGEVVAELRPLVAGRRAEVANPVLAAMVARGAVRLGAPNRPDLYPRMPRVVADGEAARMIRESRGER